MRECDKCANQATHVLQHCGQHEPGQTLRKVEAERYALVQRVRELEEGCSLALSNMARAENRIADMGGDLAAKERRIAQLEAALTGIRNMAHFAWESPKTIRPIFERIEEFARAALEKP